MYFTPLKELYKRIPRENEIIYFNVIDLCVFQCRVFEICLKVIFLDFPHLRKNGLSYHTAFSCFIATRFLNPRGNIKQKWRENFYDNILCLIQNGRMFWVNRILRQSSSFTRWTGRCELWESNLTSFWKSNSKIILNRIPISITSHITMVTMNDCFRWCPFSVESVPWYP